MIGGRRLGGKKTVKKNDTEEDGRRPKNLIGISFSGRKRNRVPLHFQVARLTAFSGRR
jgi:hypothetical protein